MNTKTKRSVKTDFETKVSSYDRVSSMLVALVMLCGLAATLMFVMWLARNISFDKSLPIIAAPFEPVGTGEFAEGIAEEFEEPGVEELADVPEPQLADAVESLTDAVSSVAARPISASSGASWTTTSATRTSFTTPRRTSSIIACARSRRTRRRA